MYTSPNLLNVTYSGQRIVEARLQEFEWKTNRSEVEIPASQLNLYYLLSQ